MRAFLRQPQFHAFVVLPLGVAAILFVLAAATATENRQLAQRLDQSTRSLATALASQPTPLKATIDALKDEKRELTVRHNDLIQALVSTNQTIPLHGSRGPEELFFGIMDFIGRMNTACEAAQIRVPENMGFGFRDIAAGGRIFLPERPEEARTTALTALHDQRQVLNLVLGHLVASQPDAITLVRRESVELPPTPQRLREPEIFALDPAMTAGTDPRLRTMAFEFTFEGQTETLRRLLNALARNEPPVLVRSVEVQPAGSTQPEVTTTAPRRQRADPTPFELAGLHSPNPLLVAEGPERPEPAVPLVDNNRSRFRVVVESFEIAALLTAADAHLANKRTTTP